jgi:RNA polymerase sigma-70 factor (ECF subfamily)
MIDSAVVSDRRQDRERDLVARSRAGESAALDTLVRENLPALWRFALGMTGDRAQAEDVAQESLARFIDGLGAFEGRCAVSTWLYSIAHSVFITQKRREGRREDVHRRHAETDRSAPEPADVDRILETLRDLEEDLRIPCALYYLERRSVDEIADALSVAASTVKWRLHRAREVLRDRLKGRAP